MPRDYRVFLDDILESINKISSYVSGFTLQSFACDSKTFDAVIRNLEIIGEAIKRYLKQFVYKILMWSGKKSET